MVTLKDTVLCLLHEYPEFRDNDGLLAKHYYCYFYNGPAVCFIEENIQTKIVRYRAYWQNQYPKLRGNTWADRQKHSKVKAKELRSQEKPENLNKWYQFWK